MMRKWFTMWFTRELEVQGYELPEDATDEDRDLAVRVTTQLPRLRASEAGTDYIEPATLPAVHPVELVDAATVSLYSPWFQPGKTP